jgi:protein-L-isoaspartate(D-aspartate) O-methyltransferase
MIVAPAIHADSFSADRLNMVESQLRARGIVDERVLKAMARVPRHQFVAESYWKQAYQDQPLPIGEGQTVSQPYIVALMLQVLALSPSDKVLEIGTGSGYLTAVLAELSGEVYSVERYPGLAREAEARLARLGYGNAKVLAGDGSEGLPAHAPFDAIIVSAAAPYLPPAFFAQLREGGRLVIPVGPPDVQELRLITKQEGTAVSQKLEGCRFVPLIGRQGYSPA